MCGRERGETYRKPKTDAKPDINLYNSRRYVMRVGDEVLFHFKK